MKISLIWKQQIDQSDSYGDVVITVALSNGWTFNVISDQQYLQHCINMPFNQPLRLTELFYRTSNQCFIELKKA